MSQRTIKGPTDRSEWHQSHQYLIDLIDLFFMCNTQQGPDPNSPRVYETPKETLTANIINNKTNCRLNRCYISKTLVLRPHPFQGKTVTMCQQGKHLFCVATNEGTMCICVDAEPWAPVRVLTTA